MKTAILGGGLTGLTIGYLLHKKEIEFEIIEKEPECGGLMKTLQENGFTFDYGGSHIIFSIDNEPLNFMLNVLGVNKVRNKRNTKILYNGHYVKYPFENGLAGLPKQDNFECTYNFIKTLIKKERGDINPPKNLKEWCIYTFGEGIAEKYLIPYNRKIWNIPTEETSLEWVERIPNLPLEDIIKSSLGIETEGYAHQLYFFYPKTGGIQFLIQTLENEIEDKIIKNFEVNNIKKIGEKWIVSNGIDEKEYDKIISTIPIFDLINSIHPRIDIKEAADNLKYNSLITVMVGLDIPKLNDLSWLYIPDEDILTHRVSFPSNYSPVVAPKGKSSVLAEITCMFGDTIWNQSDESILEIVINQLHKLEIINKDKVCYKHVMRSKYAYVVCDLNFRRNIEVIRRYFKTLGIELVGRFSEFEYLNMDACIRHSMDFVRGLDAHE